MSTIQDSGIVNDPNDWTAEHADPTYILNLVKGVVRVSIANARIVKTLPTLDLPAGKAH